MRKLIYIAIMLGIFVPKTFAQQWQMFGGANSLNANNPIWTMCFDPIGNLYAAGAITNTSGNYYVAKWNGTNWSELGGLNALAANNQIWKICSDPSGNIYATGYFTNNSGNYYVAKWNGTSWSELGGLNALSANNGIFCLNSDPSGNIYAAGAFTDSTIFASNGRRYVAKYNGAIWSKLGGNTWSANSSILVMSLDTANNIYVGGGFTDSTVWNVNGKHYIAKWNGTNWNNINGVNGLCRNGTIRTISFDRHNNLYTSGYFTNPAGFQYIVKYDGVNWSQFGAPILLNQGSPIVLWADAGNNLYAACDGFYNVSNRQYIPRWNGSHWSQLGNQPTFFNNCALLIEVLGSNLSNNIYVYSARNSNCNDDIAFFGIVNSSSFSNVTICSNQPYYFNNNYLNSTGTYYDTLNNYIGCDSFITLHLTVKAISTSTIQQNICSNQTYTFNGHNLNSSGTYYDTLTNYVGCDSIITLQLNVHSTYSTPITHNICSGQTYTFHNQTLNSGGVYKDTLLSVYGCDSIIVLTLNVINPSASTLNQSICSNQTYSFNNHTLNSSGTYYDTLVNYGGCDSIVTLNLSVLNTSAHSFSQSICSNQTYLFHNHNLNSSGIYFDTITNYLGCDSLITLNLTVKSTTDSIITQTITANYYIFNHDTIKVSGTYYDTLINAVGCDSVVVLNLTLITGINQLANNNEQLSIYPNPCSHELGISNYQLIIKKVEVSNVLGQIVLHPLISSSSNLLINVISLPSGVYFLKATDGKGFQQVVKFVKE